MSYDPQTTITSLTFDRAIFRGQGDDQGELRRGDMTRPIGVHLDRQILSYEEQVSCGENQKKYFTYY